MQMQILTTSFGYSASHKGFGTGISLVNNVQFILKIYNQKKAYHIQSPFSMDTGTIGIVAFRTEWFHINMLNPHLFDQNIKNLVDVKFSRAMNIGFGKADIDITIYNKLNHPAWSCNSVNVPMLSVFSTSPDFEIRGKLIKLEETKIRH